MNQREADQLAREALTPRQLRLREERIARLVKQFKLMLELCISAEFPSYSKLTQPKL